MNTLASMQRARYNRAVETAFQSTLQYTKCLLGSIQSDLLRIYYERVGEAPGPNTLLHEIISPLIYLRLTCEEDETYAIRFGIEPVGDSRHLNEVTVQFLRALIEYTSNGNFTGSDADVNIEDCIRADWFINCCSEMFDYIDTYNKHHTLRELPFAAMA